MSELKPVAYMHYFIGGYPPDGYTEECELLQPHELGEWKDFVNTPAEGIVPLHIIPDDQVLFPANPTAADIMKILGKSPEEFSNFEDYNLYDAISKAMIEASKAEK